MHIDWALALAGAGVGFIVGLTGMGGGALMTPMLVLVFGHQPGGRRVQRSRRRRHHEAHRWWRAPPPRDGEPPAGQVAGPGLDPHRVPQRVALQHFADPARVNTIVQYSVGAALLLASLAMVAKGAFSGRRREGGASGPITIHPLRTVLIGAFGGAVVGLTSVGSGSLMMVLLMILYPTLVASELVGTDLVQAIPLVAAAALAHMLFGHVELNVTTSLVLGAVPGVYLGRALVAQPRPHHPANPGDGAHPVGSQDAPCAQRRGGGGGRRALRGHRRDDRAGRAPRSRARSAASAKPS